MYRPTVPIAKPDSTKATELLRQRTRQRAINNSDHASSIATVALAVPALAVFLTETGSLAKLLAVLAVVSILTGYTAWGTHCVRTRRRHDRLVTDGEIVYADEHLIDLWDELRHEHNVALTTQERQHRIMWLFDAAVDLQRDLEAWARYEHEPELAEQRLLLDARIRARLLRDIQVIKVELEARQQLDALTPSVTITDEEVAAQLAVLRRREAEKTDDGKADNTPNGGGEAT